jgi:hypothetical protein
MKPLHVAILVAVSAVAGAFVMKWQIGRNTIPVNTAAATPPAAQLAPVHSQAAEPALPSPDTDEKPRKEVETPRPAPKPHRAEPVTMARNIPPLQEISTNRDSNDEPAAAPVALAPEPPVQEPAAAAPEPPSPAQPDQGAQPAMALPEAPSPPAPHQVVLKAGTLISARTVERLSSERNQAGDGFTATLDQPLVVDGWVIAERGAHLEGKVVQAQRTSAGKRSPDLAIVLTQLSTSDGQRIPIETETFEKHGQSATAAQDVTKVAVGAVIGAAIGAIAGGGKGAGIGAGVGGAAGGGAAIATNGKPAVLPAETRISFRLRNPVTVTERQNNRS